MVLVIEVEDTCDGVETRFARRPLRVFERAHQYIGESMMDLEHRALVKVSKDSVVVTIRNGTCREVTEETNMKIQEAR
jgi:hypothetical protein